MGIRYVVREMLKTYSRKNCEGCFMGYLSQLDHNLCLVEWGDQVDNYYHRVKSTLTSSPPREQHSTIPKENPG